MGGLGRDKGSQRTDNLSRFCTKQWSLALWDPAIKCLDCYLFGGWTQPRQGYLKETRNSYLDWRWRWEEGGALSCSSAPLPGASFILFCFSAVHVVFWAWILLFSSESSFCFLITSVHLYTRLEVGEEKGEAFPDSSFNNRSCSLLYQLRAFQRTHWKRVECALRPTGVQVLALKLTSNASLSLILLTCKIRPTLCTLHGHHKSLRYCA